eukprot:GFUD01010855.1.p1 GENE.GFUD01010855.1~~GFUD01010855.1.p1  ORF type:complete len:102 (-),score=16.77 GFUD01010855.1:233-538(-)
MAAVGGRSRSCSESSETGDHNMAGKCEVEGSKGVGYDMDGKFTYSQVMKCGLVKQFQTTVDENGKFSYFTADRNPVPPGWYDLDKTKHRVPIGWYQMGAQK